MGLHGSAPGRCVSIEAIFARTIGQADPVYTDLAAARAAGHRDLPVPGLLLRARAGTARAVAGGLAKVKLAVTLADGTVTLTGDAIIDLN
jgi:MaoC dehydratase-like protein